MNWELGIVSLAQVCESGVVRGEKGTAAGP